MSTRTYCSAVALAVGFGMALAAPSFAANTFTVDEHYAETGVAGTNTQNVVGDDIQFSYDSNIVLSGAVSGGTFSEIGSLQFTQFKLSNLPVGGTGLGAGTYDIVANFTASGNWSPNGAGLTATFTGFSATLYIVSPATDRGGLDSNKQFTVGAGYTDIGTLDFLSPSASNAQINTCSAGQGGNACGNWAVFTSVDLNAAGLDYFINPVPFYLDMRSSGNNQGPITIPGTLLGSPFEDQGSGDATLLNVPEPASLTLLGSALMGLGFAVRRRKKRQTA